MMKSLKRLDSADFKLKREIFFFLETIRKTTRREY